jgi:hypothetical protein
MSDKGWPRRLAAHRQNMIMEGEAARMSLLEETGDRLRRLELEAERAEHPTLFIQVPRRGILRTSPVRSSKKFSLECGASQRQKGDVVLLLPALSRERVELLHQEVPQR